MKLASLKAGGRDGTLIVVSRNLHRATAVPGHAATLQSALERWQELAPRLEEVYAALNADDRMGVPFEPAAVGSPLPRAYQWLDGSAYLPHVERVRRARGADLPATLRTDPLMYQGGSDGFLGPRDRISGFDERCGVDFEAEVAVVTGDVPLGATPGIAADCILLLMLVNDISLRNVIPAELAKGFGFLQAKPASAFSPVAVTADELGTAWDGGRVHLPLVTCLNGKLFGAPDAGTDMQFDFPALISHAARTRRLGAGTIIGSGTVSNADPSKGCSCIVEQRLLETVESGAPRTPFLRDGDRVRIEMRDRSGATIFGAIEQVFEAGRC